MRIVNPWMQSRDEKLGFGSGIPIVVSMRLDEDDVEKW